ncbi:MAG: thioredoxin domain-containing protein [Spirochaetales bacterium]|nr:thioredoxin domain-containing protein [Spirochaetales bacterium]
MVSAENKKLVLGGLITALLGVVLSALLVCKHSFPGLCQTSLGCTIDGVDGCLELGKSKHSKFPVLGFPIAYAGLFYYLWLCLQFLQIFRTGSRPLLSFTLFLVLFGLVFDLFLFYVNYFVLVVPCMLCTVTYIITFIVAIFCLMLYLKEKPAGDFMQGLKESILPGLSGLGITIVFLAVFALVAPSSEARPASRGSLLPAAEAARMVRDFKALKEVKLDAEGLKLVEGGASAYIEIHKFADFRCPHCRHAAELLERANHRWPGRLRIYYRHFPLDGSCNDRIGRKQPGSYSCNGAQASLCAPSGSVAFYHQLFAFQDEQKELSIDNIKAVALKNEYKWQDMVSCMGSGATGRAIDRDVEAAVGLKIESTPTLVVNGRLLPPGMPDVSYFLQLMDALVYEREGQAAYTEYENRRKSSGN